MPYEVVAHTADTGIAATAASLEELIRDLATGMFAIMATTPSHEAGHRVAIEVESGSVEDLVVDVLAELLTRAEIDDVVLTAFEVEVGEPNRVRVTAHGVDLRDVEAVGPPIKAVTYHDLTVGRHDDGSWDAIVYFDV